MRKLSSDAVTGAFEAQGRYKAELHGAIWRGTEVLAGSLLAYRLFVST